MIYRDLTRVQRQDVWYLTSGINIKIPMLFKGAETPKISPSPWGYERHLIHGATRPTHVKLGRKRNLDPSNRTVLAVKMSNFKNSR